MSNYMLDIEVCLWMQYCSFTYFRW